MSEIAPVQLRVPMGATLISSTAVSETLSIYYQWANQIGSIDRATIFIYSFECRRQCLALPHYV